MTAGRWQHHGELDICRDLLTSDDRKIMHRLAEMRLQLETLQAQPMTDSLRARLTQKQLEFEDLVVRANDYMRRVADLQARERDLNLKAALLRLQLHAASRDEEPA
jgi:hypothetical protein